MRKILLSFSIMTCTVLGVGMAWASFTDVARILQNRFQMGSYDLQISTDGQAWQSTAIMGIELGEAQPGQAFETEAWLRSNGSVDIQSLDMAVENFGETGGLAHHIFIKRIRYDINGDGFFEDIPEDLTSSLINDFGTGEEYVKLADLAAISKDFPFDLEAGVSNILPGHQTNPQLATDGKRLLIEWEIDPDMDATFSNSQVIFDLSFTGDSMNN